MFFKNLSIAFRFLIKHKEYTFINISGLTLSLVCVLFIGLYIYDELNFDRFHKKEAQIYRVIENRSDGNGVPAKLADVAFRISTLNEQLPVIEKTMKITEFGRSNFSTAENENKIYEPYVTSDQGFMDIFDFKVLYGSREKALTEANTIVLTKATALRLFGSENAVDKVVHINADAQPFRVSAVLDNFPPQSHLNVNLIVSFESFRNERFYKEQLPNDWSSNSFATYLLVSPGSNIPALEKEITAIANSNRDEKTEKTTYSLQALSDVHFHSADIRGGYAGNPGQVYYLYVFGAVAGFVLLIACINYINLSTSLSITRGKEVGVKKVAGAGRLHLIRQFITESCMISFASLFCAIFLMNILLPSFNQFVGKEISVLLLVDLRVIGALLGFTLFIGFVSGIYPAFYLSRFKPALAIKGFFTGNDRSGRVRQSLVVFQFALSVILIFATLIAYQQLQFIRHADLGFQHDQVVVLDINSGLVRRGAETIKNEIAKIPMVKSVSVSSRVPGEWKNIPQVSVQPSGNPEPTKLYFIAADEGFFDTYAMQLVAGRGFRVDNPADSTGLIINETAARELGFTDPLAENLSITHVNYGGSESPMDEPFNGKIIGIVKDFHFQSLHQKIAPLMIGWQKNPVHAIDYFSVRLNPGNSQAALKDMEKALQSIDPAHLIEYNFLESRLQQFYDEDTRRSQLFGLAAIISISLACLGLFALASFMTEQRTKEIGIRKVLGASAPQIVVMLSQNYLKLVIIGFILATPLAIWALGQWLMSFAYHVEIGWLAVTLSCIISICIAMLTVGYKSLRAALNNPVRSLRSE